MEIQIQKGSSRCNLCGQLFVHEQTHYSLLRAGEELFLREDYCEECWPQFLTPEEEKSLFSHWVTKYRDPSAARATPEGQFMPLLKLFYEKVAIATRDAQAFCYVCALILRRQKVFKLVREEKADAGKTMLVFHDKYNDVQVKVKDPDLNETEFRQVKQELEGHLSQEDATND